MRWLTRYGLILLFGAFLAACARTSPQPALVPYGQVDGYGYSDIKLDGNQYEIVYTTPLSEDDDVDALKQVASDAALWRASSLALSQGYLALRVISENRDIETRTEIKQTYRPAPYYGGPFGYYGFGYHPYRYRYRPYGWRYRQPYYGYGFGYGLNFGGPAAPAYRETEKQRVTVRLKVVFEKETGDSEVIDATATVARLKQQYQNYEF